MIKINISEIITYEYLKKILEIEALILEDSKYQQR